MLDEIIGDATPERVDGEEMEARDLPDLFTGQTLFASERMIVIRGLAENATIWAEAEKYFEHVSDTTTIILVEDKPDKRSRTYKLLQKVATLREFTAPKNEGEAVRFATDESKRRGMKLDSSLVRRIVSRVGDDPWNIVHTLDKLSVLDTVTLETVDNSSEANPTEQVFGLFEASLNGQYDRIRTMCQTLALSEDPYRVMGLLTTQAVQLAALVAADARASVAVDLGLKSDYGLTKLRPGANRLTRAQLCTVVDALASADKQMKSSSESPWALIEQALQKIAFIQ